MQDFTHLHVHSHYSLLDGLSKIKPLVKAAKERGFKALALTDSGSMYGAIEFYETCKKEAIKPILGFEAFVAPRSRFDKDPQEDKEAHHLILLAENYIGYRNLMKLSSLGHLEGFFEGKPRIDKALLRQYHQHVIALSGPLEGEIPGLLRLQKKEKARAAAEEYADIFGKDYFYLELEDHPALPGQMEVNTKLIELAKESGLPMVITRDVHYLDAPDAEAQDILTCIGQGWNVHQSNRADYRYVDRSLNMKDDIASRFKHVPEALSNTGLIADRIDLEIELNTWHFAPVQIPEGKTADDVLREESFSYAPHFYPEMPPSIGKRLEYELDIIKNKGYSPYFLCVADYVRYAKSHGIVESTRGSAAGSLVSYVLGITTVDPIRFKLPFERFLNPFRPSPPDIDTDFADDRREEMIEYVTKKYGEDKVAQIITFGTMAARASVRDVGRALGLSYNFCDQVAKLIPPGAQGFPMTIERALKEEPDLKKLYDSNADVKRLLDLARKVEGCARHTSIHAAGVVIAPSALTDFSPVQRETGGEKIITQYEMKSVEAAGVLKNDFLGIRNLAILGNAVEIVKKTTGDEIDIYNLPLDDKKTFEMLARGETAGVFQLSGSGMTRWLKELKPDRIEDIMAMVALYRPGPMESIPEYVRRKHHRESILYPDPRLEKILDASYGLLVYQDDVMLTAIELAGYDWMEADKFRKAMGKKIPEEMAKQKIKFYQGCRDHGNLKQSVIDELWRAIEPFAAYGFNKAHAASYGIVAYQTAYLKAHYPVQYMTAVLQAEANDTEKVAAIVHECDRMKIQVLPPDVNESFRNFAMVSKPGEAGRIRFGLSSIKGLGEHISEVIYRERKEQGNYQNVEQFLERIQDKDLNKKSLESLIQSGALDCFGHERGLLFANIEHILFFLRQSKERKTSNQNSLFSGTGISLDSKVVLKEAPVLSIEEKLRWEKNLLGLYVSSHPFADFEEQLKGIIIPLKDLEFCRPDAWVVIGGVIDVTKKKITKKGSVMMFATIQDQSGSMELLVFPRKFEESKDIWKEGEIVCVVGRVPKEDGDNKIFVENVYLLSKDKLEAVKQKLRFGAQHLESQTKEVFAKSLRISLTQEELKIHTQALKNLFERHCGEYRVYLDIMGKKIKTETKVSWNAVLEGELKSLLGDKSIEVFE
ncbi:MAG: DNA polymerase III subunit alpha [Candidatus Magasanikbacteria bacterium]|nr:DNA polymerase III subunit alpha [Candidatus Magasanikbacteria bacterium]